MPLNHDKNVTKSVPPPLRICIITFLSIVHTEQGTNARKVISEVYIFFVLQCTVFAEK